MCPNPRPSRALGLEPSIGFLHEFSNYQTKESLVYDLQEPFRCIADVTVLEAFESGVLDLKDFYFLGDDYRYRLDVDAKRRFLALLKERFNEGTRYSGGMRKWDTIIQLKTLEQARARASGCSFSPSSSLISFFLMSSFEYAARSKPMNSKPKFR